MFLARNPTFAEIGKLAIVTSILESEKKSFFREQIPDAMSSQDWYSYLFHKMTEHMIDPESYSNFHQNKVTFITFNYDRSLEYFLYDSLKNSFSLAPAEKIRDQISKIKIFHVYGVVDKLPWRGSFMAQYREAPPPSNVRMMSENIRIVHERVLTSDVTLMVEALKEASQIFFLGFGYARENLSILGFPARLRRGQQIYGTAYNFTEKEISDTRNYLSQHFELSDRKDNTNPMIKNSGCRALLKEHL